MTCLARQLCKFEYAKFGQFKKEIVVPFACRPFKKKLICFAKSKAISYSITFDKRKFKSFKYIKARFSNTVAKL